MSPRNSLFGIVLLSIKRKISSGEDYLMMNRAVEMKGNIDKLETVCYTRTIEVKNFVYEVVINSEN